MTNNQHITKKEVQDFLSKQASASLATISHDNKPHAASVSFISDEELNFYFIVKNSTKKYENLLKSPLVALVITDDKKQITVQVQGNADVNGNINELVRLMGDLSQKNTSLSSVPLWIPPTSKIQEGQYVLVKVVPAWLRYADFGKGGQQEDENCFTQLIP